MPGARDHLGAAWRGQLHVIGGRFNAAAFDTGLHEVYLPERNDWEARAPMLRSGHGLAVYRDRLFAMGGEAGLVIKGQAI